MALPVISGRATFPPPGRAFTPAPLTRVPVSPPSLNDIHAARARLSLRTVPNIDGKKAGAQLVKKLTKDKPFGVMWPRR